jgi:hypothetical protein
MKHRFLFKWLGVSAGIWLIVTTFGFAAIRDRYPEARYNERINGLIAAYILPCAIFGASIGLGTAEFLTRRKQPTETANLPPAQPPSLQEIAAAQLRRRNISERELEAWGTILSIQEDDHS